MNEIASAWSTENLMDPLSLVLGAAVALVATSTALIAMRHRAQPERATQATETGSGLQPTGPLADLVQVTTRPSTGLPPISAEIELSNPQREALSHAILATGQVGQAALNTAVASTSLVQMTMSSQLAASVAGGSARMMSAAGGGFHGAVVGPGGIAGQAVFNSAAALRGVAGVAAVWQVAAMVTAQKHLADINKRLASVERGVQKIEDILINERLGALLGHLTSHQETSQFMRVGDWHEAEVELRTVKLEDIELEARQIMYATERCAQGFLKGFDESSSGRTFGEESKELKRLLSDFEFTIKELLLAVQVRTLTVQMRSALPLCRSATTMRLDALRADIDRLGELRGRIEQAATQKIEKLGRWYKLAATEEEARGELKESLLGSSTEIRSQKAELRTTIDLIPVGDRPGETTLLIEVDDNRVPVRIRTLETNKSKQPSAPSATRRAVDLTLT